MTSTTQNSESLLGCEALKSEKPINNASPTADSSSSPPDKKNVVPTQDDVKDYGAEPMDLQYPGIASRMPVAQSVDALRHMSISPARPFSPPSDDDDDSVRRNRRPKANAMHCRFVKTRVFLTIATLLVSDDVG